MAGKKLSTSVQLIEQHNNKQRAIYKKELRRIASWGNRTMIKIKQKLIRLLISFLTLVLEIVKLLYIWAMTRAARKMTNWVRKALITETQRFLSSLAVAILWITNLLLTKLLTNNPKEVKICLTN
ncbi:MAG: hypothetical protein ABIK73_03415 [candidate division WOR-3 bacterium]